jgi:MFS family permease
VYLSFRFKFNENGTLKLLYFVNSFFVFIATLLGPLYALFVEGIKPGAMAVSFSWSVFILSSSVFLLFMSANGDRFKNKALIVAISFLVRSIAWLILAHVTTFTGLLLVQVVLAFGDALGGPTFDALLAENLDKSAHVHDYSDWRILSYISMGAGALLGGYIIDMYGFPTLFRIMACLAIIPTVMLYAGLVRK